ncbi:uncharacterized protein LOC113215298 [Frankliniella occidentalis]|uniref:Uncharacterized protein LOC113215298 n=1 Tax=Frankliniella occidentalis TaxID=133901 RepID=A0A6J1TIN5_FRAOC|nr:uncharacterized protein LOC113215298 [Frankliniella occidentalis]
MNRSLIVCGVLIAMVAALALASPAEKQPPPSKWGRAPGSPTARRTQKDSIGQQIDHTHNMETGKGTTGYLALGPNARKSSPTRTGQPSTGGPTSTSYKGKGKGKGK